MIHKLVKVVIFQLAFSIATSVWISPNIATGAATPSAEAGALTPDPQPQGRSAFEPAVPDGKAVNPPSAAVHPKVVFQINQAADASAILRFVTNYLIAEPAAEVAVVGYAGGLDSMLKGATDATGRPYAGQLQALAVKGVHFKACNNTLKSRGLSADAVVPEATIVPSAVNEIIRLQTREGYAYFRH